ncbi:DUF2333 family protein [Rhizobium bangladeshense]|uniref:DUF2333 family protein n=1 Tax=Rhizobium bangladeshense TaxID=1138189 RepID=A0ABS7LCU8_9HYPH|nr:DUF2333 family protein [Rhizobium bangladeshense]MBX4866612.1 DUF2333 family protein [Rhizobium bangladeshense]MBX4873424.1 DUF2333 family protein [Rhizobium bangladeshense]MBX4883327.1 DUF2333 family protein [Rhizobium bangladeshense]MBX4894262.1 DUF2333 family protein [Rhizobium bangladeshense]MBX4900214.1 DUF2333 family protein [Rhizobium bangladeshense]
MLDRIAGFFRLIGQTIGRWARLFSAWAFWPFLAAHGWYQRRSWMIRLPIIAFVALFVVLYGYFLWQTQVWSNFNTAFVDQYRLSERKVPAGQELPVTEGASAGTAKTCQRSAIVDVAADLTDFNVDQNAWISSMLLYKMGFFGIDWDHTPFLDNKASFQRGINQAVRRTSAELVDTLGRVRGTSGINNDLQSARGNLQFDEYSWYFGLDPFGLKTPTPSFYRTAIRDLRKFNTDLAACNAIFDGRADNLMQFIDRIANDLGSTSDMLAERSEHHNRGWFDTRADDRFWFAYGQLYAYYAILTAAQTDFSQVVRERNLGAIWGGTTRQFQAALRIQPAIISNGREDGWIMPSHLATMGFYILRVRSNLVEIRSVLDR